MNKIMTTKQVCDLLHICRTTLLKMVQEGRLPKPVKLLGNGNRYLTKDVTNFIKSLEKQQ